ncbi:BPTI/Kunitz domain-containing protein [Lamprobacter sp.]|uniref:BPTI/Kunitz domain-containing protein n=1 Tax=Lamprobacter sp. TaxID=3100796 RepID=UPI003A4E568F
MGVLVAGSIANRAFKMPSMLPSIFSFLMIAKRWPSNPKDAGRPLPGLRSSFYAAALPLLLLLGLSLVGCGGGSGPRDAADLLHVGCLQQPERGRCGQPRPAFYYDYQSDSCRPFMQGVCDPDWLFQSLRDCVRICGGRPAP